MTINHLTSSGQSNTFCTSHERHLKQTMSGISLGDPDMIVHPGISTGICTLGGTKTSLCSRQYFHKKSVHFWCHMSRLTLDLWSLTSLVISFYIWSNGHILRDFLLKGMFKTFSELTARNKLKVNIQDGLESGRSSSSGIDSAAVHAAPGTCSAS